MPAIPTYSLISHAPATARTQLATTCRYARYAKICAMNPLTGICPTRRTFLGYRYASPYGESLPFEIKWNPSAYPTPTVHCSLITAHWTFTFSAKERDSETGLSYFGSRYYSSDLSIWLSVDPMSDKYASLSPYVYCADNPVKLVDPNGEDFETEIDYDNYTITIKATFYTANSNRKELEKGIALWKEQSGKYAYSIGEGDSRTDFTIIFDLNIAEGDFETDDDALSAMSTMQSNNFFSVRDNVYNEKGEEVRGECIGGNIIYVSNKYKNNRTVAHEIGHALGCGHAFESDDLMKTGGYGSNIGIKNIRAIMFFAGFDNSGIANVGNGRNGKSCDRLQLNDGCFWGNVIKKK